MHAANSVNTPVLALFARLTPIMQLTDCIRSYNLYDKNDVNKIEVKSILQGYINLSNYVGSHPQS